jgi:hypothetical protein
MDMWEHKCNFDFHMSEKKEGEDPRIEYKISHNNNNILPDNWGWLHIDWRNDEYVEEKIELLLYHDVDMVNGNRDTMVFDMV